MKAKVRHLYEIIAGAILSLLGFGCTPSSSPDKPDPYHDIPVEYGVPHADYVIMGSVTSQNTSEPIPGIKATFRRYSYTDNDGKKHYENQEFVTDAEGKINAPMQEYMFPLWGDDQYSIILEDIDGPQNGGLFESHEIAKEDITIEQTKKGSGWYEGAFTLSFNAKMYEEMPAEYGMPHANYKVVGKVTDEDGNPIPGIEVLAKLWKQGAEVDGQPINARTDQDGNYVLSAQAWPGAEGARIEFTDTDGEENGGLFDTFSGEASLEKTAQGDGKWYEGDFSGELNVKLKKAAE